MANDYSFNHDCSCCAITLFSVTNANRQAWKDDANLQGGHKAECPTCGCRYVTEDDGVPVGSGGGVQAKDVSPPRIDSLDIVTGAVAGGAVVRVTGHGFNLEVPTVKFDGVAATSPSVVDNETLDVTTPAGKIKLNVAQVCVKLTHGGSAGGPFQVGETVTGGTSASTAVVREVDGGDAYLLVDTWSGVFTDGETLTGGTSTATATLTATVALPFQVAETVTGVTSAETATVDSLAPLKVSSPSGPFTAGEEITGGSSAARATLDGTNPMDGAVDVTIENTTYGSRPGNFLAGGFDYTA